MKVAEFAAATKGLQFRLQLLRDRPPPQCTNLAPDNVQRFTLTTADSIDGIPTEGSVRRAGKRKTLYVMLRYREFFCLILATSNFVWDSTRPHPSRMSAFRLSRCRQR
jgi:hypothetical protein